MGEGTILAAGAVLLGKEIPSRTLAAGVPAVIKKELPQKGKMQGAKTSGEYAKNGKFFKEFFEKNPEYSKF
jgi:carbonic anhydrase/acetyltransferase-like protein (isoleucine patch superfamily)